MRSILGTISRFLARIRGGKDSLPAPRPRRDSPARSSIDDDLPRDEILLLGRAFEFLLLGLGNAFRATEDWEVALSERLVTEGTLLRAVDPARPDARCYAISEDREALAVECHRLLCIARNEAFDAWLSETLDSWFAPRPDRPAARGVS